MAFDYASMAAVAKRMLTEFGTTATLGNLYSQRSVLAVRIRVVKDDYPNTNIQIGDVEFLLEAAANPVKTERITFGTDQLVIIEDPVEIKPATVILLWRVYGRIG